MSLPTLRTRRRWPATMTLGAAVVALLALASLAAPWLTDADPTAVFDSAAGKHLPPGSERAWLRFADGRSLLAEKAERRGGDVVVEYRGERRSYPAGDLVGLGADGLPETRRFPLGSDRFGRDLWARLLYGGRVSLAVGLLAVLVALTLGVIVGSLAATGGEWVDEVLMRAVDAFLAIPRLFLLVLVFALFRPGTAALVVVIGATTWMPVARLLRAEIVSLRERPFVLAARASGVGPLRLLCVHLLPNALAPVLVYAGLLVGGVILLESSLSFIGTGVRPPTPSWGNMISDGQDYLLDAWWVATFPGLALVVTVVAFNLFADGLRDRLDPRS